MSPSRGAGLLLLSLFLLCGPGACSRDRWISNTFGAFTIRDVTGDGHDDYIGWFVNFGPLKRTRLTVIDGRTGQLRFSWMANSGRLAALANQWVVTAEDSWSSGKTTYRPSVELYDLATGKVIRSKSMGSSLSRLCTVGGGVIADAAGEAFLVDPRAGTIDSVATVPSDCVNAAAIVDTSGLTIVDAVDRPAEIARLGLADARSRNLPSAASVWIGLATEGNHPVVAKVQAGQAVWSRRLGAGPQTEAWVPENAISSDVRWFVPYVDGTSARLAALDAVSGTLVWDVEIQARQSAAQKWHVCAMNAGTQLVGIVHTRVDDCDELVLVDATSGTVAFRYKRK